MRRTCILVKCHGDLIMTEILKELELEARKEEHHTTNKSSMDLESLNMNNPFMHYHSGLIMTEILMELETCEKEHRAGNDFDAFLSSHMESVCRQ